MSPSPSSDIPAIPDRGLAQFSLLQAQCVGAVIRVIHSGRVRISREQAFTMVAYTVDQRGLG